MRAYLRLLTIAVLVVAGGTLASSAIATDAPVVRLDHTTVEAHGKQSALLTVSAFGRYAVTATSAQGVALQSVDRMAGAGVLDGEPGKRDGRLDMFLDRGEYKILTSASDAGKGKATLAAYAFRELQQQVPVLVEHRLEQSSLGDFEQRSYWIEIKKKRFVAIEAAGRYLADLRLWRDGTWLVDAVPQKVVSQARAGQPLQVARLTAELSPGLYLLSAYGGPGQIWTEASTAKPFFLRFGIPTLATAMRQQHTMSEFGTDRFLVPAGADYFRLELPVAQTASLQVGSYVASNPFQADGQSAGIDKRSVPPVAELENVGGNTTRLVTVSMAAGKSYILQNFEAATTRRIKAEGEYWISSIHAGALEDSIGATAILTRQRYYRQEEYLDEQVVTLAAGREWHRRFNLLGEVTLFVKLEKPAKVRVDGSGARAYYRFEPFLISRPDGYRAPSWQQNGTVFDLDRGLYVLSISPETKGILDLHLLPPGSKAGDALSPAHPVARFPSTLLERHADYTFYLNEQGGVKSGAVLRKLPVNLDMPLPVVQRAGEALTIPVSVSERGSLRALTEDGHALEIALENGKTGSALAVEAGRYRVVVKGGDKARRFLLEAAPTRLASSTPLPPLPDARLAGLPKFPVITPDAPSFLNLDRRSTAVYKVSVDKPGFYQFESSGLLHTGGKVRTRINPSLFAAAGNGVGRNFMIQRYLREGDYQLSVSTLGQTRGDLGVHLVRSEILDGGELREGVAARALLPGARAIAYRFRIAQRGTYHLQTLGLGRKFDIRVEDDAGWPVAAPVMPGDFTRQLEPGNYRVLILPQTAEARVLTRLDRIAEPVRYQGHGPHRIMLDSTIEHTWLEPEKGAPRTPDQWAFSLPAPAHVSITMDSEMEATLLSSTDFRHPIVAEMNARRAWRGHLAAGSYLLQAKNSRSNNHVPYTLRITARQLLAGQVRSVTAPISIPVSVGADGLVELQSFGAADVRARLVDAAGRVIAQNDDRPGDWNFQIAQRLRPGEYRLQVDPVNDRQARTTVSMHAPTEITEPPLALGSSALITDAQVHIYPLRVPPGRNLLLASATSSDVVGIAIEGESASGWTNLGNAMATTPYLALPLPAGSARYKSYRLRSWSVDRRSLHLRVRAVAATLPVVPESRWLHGAAPSRVDDAVPVVHAMQIALARPGAFRLKGAWSRLQWSDSGARAAQAPHNAVISAAGKTLWLVTDEAAPGADRVLAAERLRLPGGKQESLRLDLRAGQTGTVDLAKQPGPSLVLAQSRIAQPGIALGAMGKGADSRAMGLLPGEAVAVVFPGAATSATVWDATDQGTPMELDMRQIALQPVSGRSLGVGLSDGTIKAGGALPIKLPPGGALQVRLTLAPMTAAVFLKHGVIQSTHWSGAEALYETVSADADQLWLLNADAQAADYSVEIAPGAADIEPAMKPGDLLERNLSTAGRLRIPIEIPKVASTARADQYTIRVRADAHALWLEKGGRIASGADIVIHDSGVLMLQHQPGTLIAWIDAPPAQGAQRLLSWFKSIRETAVRPPQAITLRGKQQALSLNLAHPAMLHLRTSVPVVTQFVVSGQAPQTEAHLFGANLNLLAPAGQSRLMLRAVGADSLSGVATVLTTATTALGEGVGPEVMLAPGSARLFSFELKQRSTIGIGVRASSDIVRGVLYDAHGAILSEGVVQMPTLEPGRYYIAIDLPPDSVPVHVRPVLLGLDKPDTRPPADILRRYVESRDGEPLLYVPEAAEPNSAGQGASAAGGASDASGEPNDSGESDEADSGTKDTQ